MKSRMFPFISKTWNPVVGCKHGCTYCWARKLAETKLKHSKRYAPGFQPQLCDADLNHTFRAGDLVFVSDMVDLFGRWVPQSWIYDVFDVIRKNGQAQFLLMTKNPQRYYQLACRIPQNVVLGCTIESNRNYPQLSMASSQEERMQWMLRISIDYGATSYLRRFVAVEPILDFYLQPFWKALLDMKPWAVAIGYDNYSNHLPEPPLAKTLQLVDALEKAGITVYRKTLRERWNP